MLANNAGDYYGDDFYDDVSLRRYDASGKLIWKRQLDSASCYLGDYYCGYPKLDALAIGTDSRKYSYALVTASFNSSAYGGCEAESDHDDHYVYKYDAAGRKVKSIYVGSSGDPSGGTTNIAPTAAADLAVDGSGNFYIVRQNADFGDDACRADLTNVFAKYSTNGSLLWQRIATVGTLSSVSVSSRGDVYVTGSTGVAKYTSSGNLTWTKSGEAFEAAASGTNVYLRSYKTSTVRKLDANGKQLWSKTQSGLSGMVIGAMIADANGNIYLTGKYNASSSNRNIFTRKLNSSGRVLWTKTFGTSAYDDARGIATLNGSEIYLTGATQGALAHPYRGGDNDGYIAKLSGSGNPVWKR